MNSRVVYREHEDVLEISIPEKKNLWGRLIVPLWLGFWTVYGLQGFPGASWAVLWVFAELLGLYTWLWNELGEEVIRVGGGTLSVKHAIFGRGFTRRFSASMVRDLRAAGFFEPDAAAPVSASRMILNLMSFGFILLPDWSLKQGTVTFNYGKKVFRIGARLTKEEAQNMVEKIRPYLRESRRKTGKGR